MKTLRQKKVRESIEAETCHFCEICSTHSHFLIRAISSHLLQHNGLDMDSRLSCGGDGILIAGKKYAVSMKHLEVYCKGETENKSRQPS
jgi:hypothetical protein